MFQSTLTLDIWNAIQSNEQRIYRQWGRAATQSATTFRRQAKGE